MLTACWLWGCVAILLFLSPITSVVFDIKYLTWTYSADFWLNRKGFEYMPYVEVGVSNLQNGLGTIFYLLIAGKLFFLVSLKFFKNFKNSKFQNKSFKINNCFKTETKLLIQVSKLIIFVGSKCCLQAVIIGVYCIFMSVYWNLLLMVLDPAYSTFLGMTLVIIQNGMNPFLYLALNE